MQIIEQLPLFLDLSVFLFLLDVDIYGRYLR
jgi:hypothetical protein